jgi:hypothetical protein
MAGKQKPLVHKEKLSALRQLLHLLINFHIVEIACEALLVNRDLRANNSAATVDRLAACIGTRCMQISPGAKTEIVEKLKEQLNLSRKGSPFLEERSKAQLDWLGDKFPDSSEPFYIAGLSEASRIRQFICCSGLPSDAVTAVVLPPSLDYAEAAKKENRTWFTMQEVDKLFLEVNTDA